MNKNIVWLSTIIFCCACGQNIFADGTNIKTTQPCSCTCNKPSVKELHLSAEQETKIKAIREQASVVKAMNMKAMLTIHNQIEKLIRIGKLDDIKLDVLLDQKKDIMATMIKNRILVKHEIYSVLTPQQKTQYDGMMLTWEKNNMEKLDNMQDEMGL